MNVKNIEYLVWEPMINEKWTLLYKTISLDVEKDIFELDLVIVASDWVEFNDLLKNYDNTVIDLKFCIWNNGMMNLRFLGKGKYLFYLWF